MLVQLILPAIPGHAPAGGALEFALSRNDTAVVISVKDEGRGLPLEDLDRIFEPFFTRKETGTGLWLSVARQIVSQHFGIIEAQPDPLKGMTFRVLPPVHRGRLA